MAPNHEKSSIPLEEQVILLTTELRRLQAIHEINNLMANYEAWHYPHLFYRKEELFAMTKADVSIDISDGGIVTGPDAVRFLWNDLLGGAGREPGAMFIHCLTTGAIQVAGDGQTAKATWISPGTETFYQHHSHRPPRGHVEGDAPMRAYWCWGRYACDFILEDGKWKIWHMKWIREFRCDYYSSWVDDTQATKEGASYPKFDRDDIKPVRFHEPYKDRVPRKAIPAMPQPYEHFDDPDWIYDGYRDIIPPRQ